MKQFIAGMFATTALAARAKYASDPTIGGLTGVIEDTRTALETEMDQAEEDELSLNTKQAMVEIR